MTQLSTQPRKSAVPAAIVGGLLLVAAVAAVAVSQSGKRQPAQAHVVQTATPAGTAQLANRQPSASAATAPTAPNGTYSTEIPARYPSAHRTWATLIGQLGLTDHFADPEATSSPIRVVTLDGRRYLYGFACENQNCGNEAASILFSEDQAHVFGEVDHTPDGAEAPQTTPVGTPTEREAACLQRLEQDEKATSC